MYLFINTADSEVIILALLDRQGEVLIKNEIAARYRQSEKLLVEIEELEKECRQGPSAHASETLTGRFEKDLQGIIVVTGPGSFTALRIGVTTANTLAFAWGIAVVGVTDKGSFAEQIKAGLKLLKKQKGFRPVTPEYGMEPNITLSSK